MSLSLRGEKSLIFFSAINISVQRHGKRRRERTNEQVRNHCIYTKRGMPRKTGLPSSLSISVCIPPTVLPLPPPFSIPLSLSSLICKDLQKDQNETWAFPAPESEQNPVFSSGEILLFGDTQMVDLFLHVSFKTTAI